MNNQNNLIQRRGQAGERFLVTPDADANVSDHTELRAWFSANFWREQQAITGQSKGRNTVYFVRCGEQEWVLRHYYRGGLPGKLLRDLFFYTGVMKTRSFQELELLWRMYHLGLPMPKPIAAYQKKRGLTYQADILIERIPHSQDLFQCLQEQTLPAEQWHRIGATIARFHQTGVYHSDLNCHNILLQRAERCDKVWVIDFDRCEFRSPGRWQVQNLERLHRSLEKEQQKFAAQAKPFYFNSADWQHLIQGYVAGDGDENEYPSND